MTPDEFREALGRLGISQTRCGVLMMTDPRTVRRWAAGEVPVPGPVIRLLEAWQRHGLPPGDQS